MKVKVANWRDDVFLIKKQPLEAQARNLVYLIEALADDVCAAIARAEHAEARLAEVVEYADGALGDLKAIAKGWDE